MGGITPLRIEAVNTLLDWMGTPNENRQRIWLELKQIDNIFLKFHSKKMEVDKK